MACLRLLKHMCARMCTASEMTEIRNAVSSLKASLEAMRTNTEPADAKILMLNLKVRVTMCVHVCAHMRAPISMSRVSSDV